MPLSSPIRLLVLLLALLSSLSCARSPGALAPQTVVANEIAKAANVAGVELGARMGAALLQCVDEAGTRADSTACRLRVESAWSPVWKAWDAVRAAHDAWTAVLLQQGGDLPAASSRFKDAWCGLRAVVPPPVNLPPVGDCS